MQRIQRDNEQRGFPTEVSQITPDCLSTLLSASEVYLKNIMEDAYIFSRHSNRVTLMRKDIQQYNHLMEFKRKGNK